VAGYCECGDELSVSCATELVSYDSVSYECGKYSILYNLKVNY
jgi:hypothetical protein